MTRQWKGYWIGTGKGMVAPSPQVGASPYFRKTFECKGTPRNGIIYLCGLGWHEVYVNGKKVDDRVLAPVVTQFDKRDSYIEYDVTALLRDGENAVVVWLGNGWYNCHTAEVWSFDKAPWRDWPKLLCDIVVDGEVVAKSDTSWLKHDSPITFDALRNGERYDARLEQAGFAEVGFDETGWSRAVQTTPPGGVISKEELEPCKVMKEYEVMSSATMADGSVVYDFGTNLTGWCEIAVEGEAGGSVELRYTELLNEDGSINQANIDKFVKQDGFQTDIYTLKGDGIERYRPRFTYHGFRYVGVTCKGNVTVKSLKAQFVYTAFEQVGTFTSSCSMLNRLQEITIQSYLSNFTGIPTDCPHREKNGWTGDAQLACETGLWNFDGKRAYEHFVRLLADTQRPSGQLPGIAPSGGWGYNWGSGPAWDIMLFEGVWQIYLYYGDLGPAWEHYDAMAKYVEYCRGMSEDNLVRFGLGDWCHWNQADMAPTELTSSCYYYLAVVRLAEISRLLGKGERGAAYDELARDIKASFNAKYYNGDGTYANGVITALAAPLYFGIAEADQALTAQKLVERVRELKHIADFGILGAKYVPRILSDYGYAEDAFTMLVQEEFPGWGNWIKRGATTLWESWRGGSSHNHIMYGDVSAWMYQYLGGVSPMLSAPGFKRFKVKPCFVPQLDYADMTYKTGYGMIRVSWKRESGGVTCHVRVPEGCVAELELPGKAMTEVVGTGVFTA